MLWDDAIEGFWLEKRKNVSTATVKDYSYTFRRFHAFLDDDTLQFEAITTDHVRRFLDALARKGLSGKSVLNAWVALSSLWTWAEAELGIAHVIRRRIARPKFHRPQIEPYTRAEVGSMLEAATRNAAWTSRNGKEVIEARSTGLRDRAIILVLLDSGIRAQELCDLQIGDYVAKSGRLHIRHGKGNKSRYVFLGDVARKALWRYLAHRADADEPHNPLFATRTLRPLERNALRHMIERCAERAGVDKATVHRFRHTFAINYLRNRGTVLELQRLMGHESTETLHVYVRLAESDLQDGQRRASPADNWRL